MAEPIDLRARARLAAVWLARLVVAAVFVLAAVPKLLDPAAFAEDIAAYQVFPYWSWNLIATVVPALELLAALALLSGLGRRGAVAVLAGLDLVFIALIASVIARGLDLDCGCFGRDEAAVAVGWPTLLRDLLLLAGIVIAALPTDRPWSFTATRPTKTGEPAVGPQAERATRAPS